MRVAVATCRELPHPDVDEPLLLAALEARGIDAKSLAWEEGAAAFAAYDLVVVRSTWNYVHHAEAFLSWARAIGPRLLNPPAILRWNAHKTYLRELEARGIATVPTVFVGRGEEISVDELFRDRGWKQIVIKPTVSAGSFRTERFPFAEAGVAQAFLEDLTRDRDAMVQPYMDAVETYGERSLVWVDGTLTHAIRKEPRYGSVSAEISGAVPFSEAERAFAERVLAPFADDLLYARVDTIRDGADIRLMELELIEPFLFCVSHPPAAEALAEAIAKRG